jgi:D-alanine-D-alanine ligase
LPVIEIRPRDGFYDYDAKYVDDDTQYLFDTIEPSLAVKIQEDALLCFEALGLRHVSRIDFILRDDGEAFVLEANTIPGMTSHSLVPKAAERMGLSMSELCARIVGEAVNGSDKTTGVSGSGLKE